MQVAGIVRGKVAGEIT